MASSSVAGGSGHRKLALALVILGTILAIVAVFSIWANRQALNTDNWVHTSDRILENKDVESRLSAFIAAQLFAHVDVKAELEKELPPKLAPLAGPTAAGLTQLAPEIAERALGSPRVQALWSTANRVAHESLLKLLDGGGDALSTEGGKVTLDLNEVLKKVSGQLGVGAGLATKIPPEAGKLTILRSDQISTAQKIAKLIRTLPIVLTLLVLILYGAAIYLAGPRRREAVRSVGLGLAIAGALVLTLRSVAGHAIANSLVAVDANKPAAEAVWSIATSLLATVATSALALRGPRLPCRLAGRPDPDRQEPAARRRPLPARPARRRRDRRLPAARRPCRLGPDRRLRQAPRGAHLRGPLRPRRLPAGAPGDPR